MKADPSPNRRAPNGLDSAKPVVTRLSKPERARLEQFAQREQRTLGAASRLLILRGMDAQDRVSAALGAASAVSPAVQA